MQKIYNNYDFTYVFDFEKVCSEVEVTLRHLSLFSVCFHFLTCLRSCDKVTNYCFFCSRVRDHSYGDRSYYHDVVVANQVRAYQDDYMFLQDKLADFDVFLERPIYMNFPNFPLNDSKCDFYTELRHAQDLFVPFVNVLARLYINYVSKYFCQYKFTLRDEKIVYDAIYFFGAELMHDFFQTNYAFFYEFLNKYDEFNRSHCHRINKLNKQFGPYDNEPFRMSLEFIVL